MLEDVSASSAETYLLKIMRISTAVLAGVAAVALSACGGGGGLNLDPVASAASKTMRSSGEKVEMRAILWTGRDWAHRNWWGSMLGGGVMTSKAADLTIDVSPLEGPSFTVREIYVSEASGPVIYFSSSELNSRLPRGKSWLRIDVAKLVKRELGAKSLPQTNDPSQFLRLLRSRGLRPVKRGEATIDGQKTARYHVDLDVEKAFRSAGVSSAGARLLRQQLKSATVPIDVWVDEDGYLRREHLKLAARPFTTVLTMTLSDFGRDVSIEPPPAGSTVDALTSSG
jgi:LppX_LprAFG lipoprotein